MNEKEMTLAGRLLALAFAAALAKAMMDTAKELGYRSKGEGRASIPRSSHEEMPPSLG